MRVETPQAAATRFSQAWVRKGFKRQALHEYQTAEGQPLYWRIRLKQESRDEKWIRPMFCHPSGQFVLGEPPFQGKKPLYRLPELLQAKEATVWIVEGEWCADHLAKKGLNVTTSGGADSAQAADWSVLAGRNVVIWPDGDETGKRYAAAVTAQLSALNCRIQWVATHALGLPPKGDGVDWCVFHSNSISHSS